MLQLNLTKWVVILVFLLPIPRPEKDGVSEKITESFFSAAPQNNPSRTIKEHLTSAKSINLSQKMEIYNAGILASTKNTITIFDLPTFSFYTFDRQLNHLETFGSKGRGPGEFVFPIDADTDKHGNFWIADGDMNIIKNVSLDGSLVHEFKTPFGVMPHRLDCMENGNLVVLSLFSKHSFSIFNPEGELITSFLEMDGLTPDQRGFLIEGRVASADQTIYYAGRRNNMLKAFTKDGEQIYSRYMIEPKDHDFLNMSTDELRSAPTTALDIEIYKNTVLVLYDGNPDSEYRWRYIDVYDRNTGDYLYSYTIEHYANRITTLFATNWTVLGFDMNESSEMRLTSYKAPF